MLRFFAIFLGLLAFSCNKPDAKPELRDPIYQDMMAQKEITARDLAAAQKSLEEHQANLSNVVPQTGQIKYAEKRFWEAKKLVETLSQQEKYWIIRIRERIKYARTAYLKAYEKGESWPDSKEIDEYMAEKRLRQAKKKWDVKQRMDQLKNSTPEITPESH